MTEGRPESLLPRPAARLLAVGLLAALGSLQWARMVDVVTDGRALLWAAAGVAAGLLVVAAQRAPAGARAAATWVAAGLGLALAAALSGLELSYLRPARWGELGDGVARGLEALNSVRLPYIGRDPWVGGALELTGAVVCALAGILAGWPRGGMTHRLASLALLIVLVASPVVALGVAQPVALGLALAALAAALLWLERVPGRPGLGVAVLAAVAMAAAVPLGSAADREEPWFDYKAFAEGLGPGNPVTFRWSHGYGPIDWPREGVELFRVRQTGERNRPMYWKADVLYDFDGNAWTTGSRTDPGGDDAAADLPGEWRERREWAARFQVSVRRLRSAQVVGAGTVLDVDDSSRSVEPGALPGLWVTSGARMLGSGDNYTVEAYVPDPTPAQLSVAGVGADPRREGTLTLRLDFPPGARPPRGRTSPTPVFPPGRPIRSAEIYFPPFGEERGPRAHYPLTDEVVDGERALRNTYYDRTWALAKELRQGAATPYEYVVRVNNLLRGPRFRYTEVPPDPGAEPPLEAFLFDSRAGYCQQFSGAMALLLRMGGIPARVATGFSPGGVKRSSGEWVVRDTDAHSWVEAWFDGIGWVTFDPTPPATPARSQTAAIAPPRAQAAPSPTPTPRAGADPGARRPEGLLREPR